jgi:hypothetical protein
MLIIKYTYSIDFRVGYHKELFVMIFRNFDLLRYRILNHLQRMHVVPQCITGQF